MDDGTKIRIAEKLEDWCDRCRLYAMKFFIWNTEAEQLVEVIAEALDTLPGKVSANEWQETLRASLANLPHCWLWDMSEQVTFLLNNTPCKTDGCQKACDEIRGKI
jgi:hypothetical protein